MDRTPLLQVRRLSKSYGGVHALKQVNIDVEQGEIHALCGENGAGKSTLIKCLTGVEVPDQGSVLLDGRRLAIGNVRGSEAAGIAVIHQQSTAFGDLSAMDNVFVGREPRKARGWLLDRPRMRRETIALLQRLGQQFDIDCPVRRFSVAQRQLVAVARALSRRCRLLIMDEPTASLSAHETDVLLGMIRSLRDEGVTILFVSHRIDELLDTADRISVLRDGQYVATRPAKEIDKNELIRLMVGRPIESFISRRARDGQLGDVRLEVKRLSRPGVFHEISFHLRAGEIVGIAGLVGAGRSEVVRAIFGVDRYDTGQVLVDGKPLPGGNVATAVRHGLALVPEDRQHEGLVLPMTVATNLCLAVLHRLASRGLVSRSRQSELVERLMNDLLVKAPSQEVAAQTLSGGNQQKLVLGKWLAAKPRILLLDEPTKGVDVAAKAQVHRLIRQLTADGMATLIVSSEASEILSMSNRILVMREGRIAGELDGNSATQEQVLQLAIPEESEIAKVS